METEPTHQQIAKQLLEMSKLDQEMRFASIRDKTLWDDSIDTNNTAKLKEIVEEIGWPTVSRVGFEASHAAWLLLQHAYAEPNFMKACLELMKSEASDVAPENIAYLEDRLLTMDGLPQIYGTQFRRVSDDFIPFPISDPEHVDERRALVGLGTFEANLERLRREYTENS